MKFSKILPVALPVLALFAVTSCKPDLEEAGLGLGSANLQHYVAFGDSYTAGFTNGGLYSEGQLNSYPAIMAGQMQLAGAPAGFVQPILEGNGTGYYQLVAVPANTDTIAPATGAIRGPFANSTCYPYGPSNLLARTTVNASTLQNLGVPNMRLAALTSANLGNIITPPANPSGLNPVLTANPYFERLLPGETNSESYVQVAHSTQATFFTVWFGIDDMVNWALSGGTCGPRPIPANNVTGPVLGALLDTLAANGAKGVVARIPKVVEFPYFKLVNVDEQKARAKTLTGDANATVWHQVGSQAIEVTNSDIILYHALAGMGQPDANGNLHGFSAANPLTNAEVLTPAEVGLLNGTASSFNLALPQILTGKRNFPVAYLDDFISGVTTTGYQYGGVNYTGQYITGEFFSLDGLHFSARGNALIANKFIEEINRYYGAFIPQVNPSAYPSTQRPN